MESMGHFFARRALEYQSHEQGIKNVLDRDGTLYKTDRKGHRVFCLQSKIEELREAGYEVEVVETWTEGEDHVANLIVEKVEFTL